MPITTSKSSPFHSAPPQRQSGAMALVVGVILFFGATLIALYTTDPVRTEQQVAGNEYRAFQALNAAEAGLGHVQSFFISGGTDDLCGPHSLGPNGDRGSFAVIRIDNEPCDSYEAPSDVDAIGYRTVNIEVEGRSDDGSAIRNLSQSVFLMDFGEGESEGTLAPLNFAGQVNFEAPNSNAFRVDGSGGPAISLQDAANRDAVINAIAEVGRADNYSGPISDGGFGEPWDSPAMLNEFVTAIESTPGAGDGSQGLDGINVIDGDFEMKGNDSGSGILVVKGGFTTTGTPSFDGLIIVLGGSYTMTGGGQGGVGGGQDGGDAKGGSVFVSNLIESTVNGETQYQYGETSFESSGGGNAQFTFNFDALNAARDLLSEQARDLWHLEDPSGPSGPNIYGAGIQTGIIDGSWVDFE
ncbi:pilus assembly PilX N-terminal domain-containing protein [Thioalkalivibrio sp. ALgr1]|uniref:pilus assembly PilX N-terminal domain-containing protein n=1 Tax=Thioalkalivibrio sp. ALgr1 TaxID=748655 RepID=UPI001E51DD50|nr:pilus assembly PilX N-terminal domain-containing protein [Thioalkalivibrio sp. ALgr1]